MVVWDGLGMAVICWGRWELRGEREAAALSAGGGGALVWL